MAFTNLTAAEDAYNYLYEQFTALSPTYLTDPEARHNETATKALILSVIFILSRLDNLEYLTSGVDEYGSPTPFTQP